MKDMRFEQPAVAPVTPEARWPPTLGVSSFFSANNAQEIIVALGRTLMRPSANGKGFEATVDWFNCLSLSPESAYVLWSHLGQQLAMYEARYGDIPKPKDPLEGVVDHTQAGMQ